MKIVNIEATTIPDAWFQCIRAIHKSGSRSVVQQGSFVQETRLEFDFVTVHIKYPYALPYDAMLPEIPPHLGIPNPVMRGYVEDYMPYLMESHVRENESYTYGSRIVFQLSKMRTLLRETPNTNQAILQVARPEDCILEDPPCLRHIDIRVKDGRLHFFPYFRSWDLWAGFPANLAAIAVLQNFLSAEIGIEQGSIVASSKGLHVYGYVETLSRIAVSLLEGSNA